MKIKKSLPIFWIAAIEMANTVWPRAISSKNSFLKKVFVVRIDGISVTFFHGHYTSDAVFRAY